MSGVTISLSVEETRTLLSIVHGAIDDAEGDEEEIRLLVEIESKVREARYSARTKR